MHGAIFPMVLAGIVFPSAEQCFVFAAPILAVAAVWWLINRTDRIVHRLFPYLEWEHSLGWLNIGAERRANMAVRWVGYAIYILLIDALYGIVWGAEGLQQLDNWSDPWVMGNLALRVPALGFCLGIWVLYLGGWLIPKLRAEREATEWKKFRAKAGEAEREHEPQPHSRVHSPLRKPRTNALPGSPAPPVPLAPDRTGKRRGPGG